MSSMEAQDLIPNSIPNANPTQDHNLSMNFQASLSASPTGPPMLPNTLFLRGPTHHRRAHSDMNFRIPDDMSMMMMMNLSPPSDPVHGGGGGGGAGCGGSSTASHDEIGSEDDLFSTYINVDKLTTENCTDYNGGACEGGEKISAPNANMNTNTNTNTNANTNTKTRHRYSSSMDGGSSEYGGDIMDAKKAMPPDKLAELWTVDPKRAKRILANRQSAARSKERKAQYIVELERKVQTLQTEATTLSAQLTLFQRDTTGLTSENTELKLRLQSMEQQAQLRDALNDALRKEVDRLKFETGEITSPSELFNLGMQQMPYASPHFSPFGHQQDPNSIQNMQFPPFNHPSTMPIEGLHQPPSHQISPTDPIFQFQGLDINSRGTHIVKSEVPSLSASESSSTY